MKFTTHHKIKNKQSWKELHWVRALSYLIGFMCLFGILSGANAQIVPFDKIEMKPKQAPTMITPTSFHDQGIADWSFGMQLEVAKDLGDCEINQYRSKKVLTKKALECNILFKESVSSQANSLSIELIFQNNQLVQFRIPFLPLDRDSTKIQPAVERGVGLLLETNPKSSFLLYTEKEDFGLVNIQKNSIWKQLFPYTSKLNSYPEHRRKLLMSNQNGLMQLNIDISEGYKEINLTYTHSLILNTKSFSKQKVGVFEMGMTMEQINSQTYCEHDEYASNQNNSQINCFVIFSTPTLNWPVQIALLFTENRLQSMTVIHDKMPAIVVAHYKNTMSPSSFLKVGTQSATVITPTSFHEQGIADWSFGMQLEVAKDLGDCEINQYRSKKVLTKKALECNILFKESVSSQANSLSIELIFQNNQLVQFRIPFLPLDRDSTKIQPAVERGVGLLLETNPKSSFLLYTEKEDFGLVNIQKNSIWKQLFPYTSKLNSYPEHRRKLLMSNQNGLMQLNIDISEVYKEINLTYTHSLILNTKSFSKQKVGVFEIGMTIEQIGSQAYCEHDEYAGTKNDIQINCSVIFSTPTLNWPSPIALLFTENRLQSMTVVTDKIPAIVVAHYKNTMFLSSPLNVNQEQSGQKKSEPSLSKITKNEISLHSSRLGPWTLGMKEEDVLRSGKCKKLEPEDEINCPIQLGEQEQKNYSMNPVFSDGKLIRIDFHFDDIKYADEFQSHFLKYISFLQNLSTGEPIYVEDPNESFQKATAENISKIIHLFRTNQLSAVTLLLPGPGTTQIKIRMKKWRPWTISNERIVVRFSMFDLALFPPIPGSIEQIKNGFSESFYTQIVKQKSCVNNPPGIFEFQKKEDQKFICIGLWNKQEVTVHIYFEGKRHSRFMFMFPSKIKDQKDNLSLLEKGLQFIKKLDANLILIIDSQKIRLGKDPKATEILAKLQSKIEENKQVSIQVEGYPVFLIVQKGILSP